ncbi:hypothetical protein Bca101_044871 [Brassica carinata]
MGTEKSLLAYWDWSMDGSSMHVWICCYMKQIIMVHTSPCCFSFLIQLSDQIDITGLKVLFILVICKSGENMVFLIISKSIYI